jgi:hypothetical protein
MSVYCEHYFLKRLKFTNLPPPLNRVVPYLLLLQDHKFAIKLDFFFF